MRAVLMDSGIGGASILKTIISKNFFTEIVFLADQKYCPYGERPKGWIRERILKIAAWASTLSPDMFLIACNTATVSAISEVRKLYPFHVIGVEPVVKPLNNFSKSLLLATKTTLRSRKTNSLIRTHISPQTLLITHTPSKLVQAIEDMDKSQIKACVRELAHVVGDSGVEAIGLSCTHYPLVRDDILKVMPQVRLLDPSDAVAKRVEALGAVTQPNPARIRWLTTGDSVRLRKQIASYLHLDAAVEEISL